MENIRSYFDSEKRGVAEWHTIDEKPEPYSEVYLVEYDEDGSYVHGDLYVYLEKGCELSIETGVNWDRLAPLSPEERMLEQIFTPKTIFTAFEDGFYFQVLDSEAPFCVEPERIVKRRLSKDTFKYKWCYTPKLEI